MRFPQMYAHEMGCWVLYGDMLLSIIADDMGSDPGLVTDMDGDEQLDLARQWYDAGGCFMRCKECYTVYGSRVKICEGCGEELHRDHWYTEAAGKMLGVLMPKCE